VKGLLHGLMIGPAGWFSGRCCLQTVRRWSSMDVACTFDVDKLNVSTDVDIHFWAVW